MKGYFYSKGRRNVIVYRLVNGTGKMNRGDIQWVALGNGRYATRLTLKKRIAWIAFCKDRRNVTVYQSVNRMRFKLATGPGMHHIYYCQETESVNSFKFCERFKLFLYRYIYFTDRFSESSPVHGFCVAIFFCFYIISFFCFQIVTWKTCLTAVAHYICVWL